MCVSELVPQIAFASRFDVRALEMTARRSRTAGSHGHRVGAALGRGHDLIEHHQMRRARLVQAGDDRIDGANRAGR
jgi:hypothetical protein